MPDTNNRKQLTESHVVRPVQVAYVLAYRAPRYVRTENLLTALRSDNQMKVAVARNRHSGLRRYIETWHALRQLRTKVAPDIYVIGFRGHEIFWTIRWLARGKPLIFDAMMSPYGALRHEHGDSARHRWLAEIVYPFERWILRRADLVLTDTRLHAEFYARTFGLPIDHFFPVPVGAIEFGKSATTSTHCKGNIFSVLFYGSFLPLHGVQIIVAAAAQLTDLPIRFDFIGGSKTQARGLLNLCEASGVTNFSYRHWVEFEQLLQKDIPNADLCLGGPFGGTPQARRVVTTKTSQCLALGKATVIGHIDEDYGFVDRNNCLLVAQADPDALAASIRWAFKNHASLSELGARGRDTYNAHLSTRVIAKRLQSALAQLATNSTETRPS